jgi:hypothetical protein
MDEVSDISANIIHHKICPMDQTGQYYFSVELLNQIISTFSSKSPLPDYRLKGFVFIPAFDTAHNPCIFPFPLYSPNVKGGSDEDLLLQNTDASTGGCPYPPPCSTKMDNGSCYM